MHFIFWLLLVSKVNIVLVSNVICLQYPVGDMNHNKGLVRGNSDIWKG